MNAIILAGGQGSRLDPWHAPKPLLPINGIPMLQSILKNLQGLVNRITVCTGYRASDIKKAIFGWDLVGYSICFSDTQVLESMGSRLLSARSDLEYTDISDNERFIILYADELADVDIKSLVAKHECEQNWITFVAARQKLVGGKIFYAPITVDDSHYDFVNIGFAVVEPPAWDLLKPEDGLSQWINRVSISGHPVGVYHHEGKRATVNSLADLKYAEEIWK